MALSNSSGNNCQSYVYSAYGRVWAEYPEFKANPYMFTGRRFDYETGLYYYRARYYNPYIGRFLQTDPVGYSAGMNLYAYCGNNPLNWVDPSGLYQTTETIPLEVIWHQSSMGAYLRKEQRYVITEDDPQHKKDVQSFLAESNFYREFLNTELLNVIFDEEKGEYKCTFEVPDEYKNFDIDTDDSLGITIIEVETGGFFSKESVAILDWRLLGMLDDKLRGIQASDPSGAIEQKFLSDLLTIIATYSDDIYLGAISQGVSVISFYYTVAYPSEAVPNFSTWESYYTYVMNMADGGYDTIWNTRYDNYKAEYGHLNEF